MDLAVNVEVAPDHWTRCQPLEDQEAQYKLNSYNYVVDKVLREDVHSPNWRARNMDYDMTMSKNAIS